MAGTINLANVAIGFDVSKIQKGTEFSGGELRKLSKIVQDSVSPVDKYNRELQLLEKAHKAGAISADRHAQAIAHLQAKHKQGLPEPTNSFAMPLKGMTAQYLGLAAVGGAVTKSLSLAAVAESNKIALEVLTGSAQKAQMLFDGFTDLDRNSPLSRSEFSKAAQVLIGYGYAAESTLPTLERLSQISMGNADKLQSLSLAFGQVQANGRLMGQEVLQMINAGFNPLQEISRTTGKGMIQLKTDLEAGAISAGMVEDAFKSATTEGGRFHGMNERLKDSLSGQFAKMSSDIEMAATEFGTKLTPAAKEFVQVLVPIIGGLGDGLAAGAGAFSTGIQAITSIGQDALTNLDGNAKGTKFAEFWDKQETDQLTKKMKLEMGFAENTAAEKEKIAAMAAKRQAKEREEMEAIAKKEKEIADLQKQADEQAKQAAAQKKRDRDEAFKKEQRAFEETVKSAEELKKATKSPLDGYLAEFQRLQDLFNEGFINEQTFNKGNEDALKKAAPKDKDTNPNKLADTIAPALRAGSVEAYKFLLQQKEDASQLAKEQVDLAKVAIDLQREHIDATKAIPMVGRAR